MSLNLKEIVGNIFHTDKKEKEQKRKIREDLQQKFNNVVAFGNARNTIVDSVNPFLKNNGELVNPNLNYQALLNNPNIAQRAKNYITQVTGLTPAQRIVKTTATTRKASRNTAKNNSGFYQREPVDERGVGFISAKYESGGNGGTVSSGNGDQGGVSYGVSQFATNTGSADGFVSWLKQNNPAMASAFKQYKAGTAEFSSAWKQTFVQHGDNFTKVQQQYTYDNYVKKLVDLAKKKTGIDYNRSAALRELVYSTAIQFGPYDLGLSALGDVNAAMTDEEIIKASYDKKISNYKNYFKGSSASVQEGVKNRFIKEREDVLQLLYNEQE